MADHLGNLIFCFNHMVSNAKVFLEKLKVPEETTTGIMCRVCQIMSSQTMDELENNVRDGKDEWPLVFLQYFVKHMEGDIRAHGTPATYAKYPAFKDKKATNNCSESFNAQLKRLLDWKEVPMDTLALMMYEFQLFKMQ